MKETKWYVKVLTVLLIVILSPIIVLGLLLAVPSLIRESRRAKKAYFNSPYYADFKEKYTRGITTDPVYRFYNGAVARKLPVKCPEKFDERFDGSFYFFYDDAMFLFPDFEQMGLSEEDGITWQVNYDGDWVDFEEAYAKIRAKSMDSYKPVKLLVERSMITVYDLNKVKLPSCVFVTWSYDTAFENEESPLKMMVPQTAEDLYAMMRDTPDLCGEFEPDESGNGIRWRIREDIQITLGVYPRDCYVGVDKLLFGKIESEITHWHPTEYEIYDEVCKIGKRGNVLVLRSRAGSGAVLYSGSKADCPYPPDKKYLFAKYYYIEAN